jgi:hypothetical protein
MWTKLKPAEALCHIRVPHPHPYHTSTRGYRRMETDREPNLGHAMLRRTEHAPPPTSHSRQVTVSRSVLPSVAGSGGAWRWRWLVQPDRPTYGPPYGCTTCVCSTRSYTNRGYRSYRQSRGAGGHGDGGEDQGQRHDLEPQRHAREDTRARQVTALLLGAVIRAPAGMDWIMMSALGRVAHSSPLQPSVGFIKRW